MECVCILNVIRILNAKELQISVWNTYVVAIPKTPVQKIMTVFAKENDHFVME